LTASGLMMEKVRWTAMCVLQMSWKKVQKTMKISRLG